MTEDTKTKIRAAASRFADEIAQIVQTTAPAPSADVTDDLQKIAATLSALSIPTGEFDFDIEFDVTADLQSSTAHFDGMGSVDAEMSIGVDVSPTSVSSNCDDLSDIADEVETAAQALEEIVAALTDSQM